MTYLEHPRTQRIDVVENFQLSDRGITAPSIVTINDQCNLSLVPDVKNCKLEPEPHQQTVHGPVLYQLYDSADNISYTPEAALQAGLGMVKTLKAGINKLELGSKLRKDVWLREIDKYVISLA